MEKHIFDAMNDDIIKVAAPKYGVSFEQIKRLGGFENFIYEFTDKGNDYVLRFVHSNHRTFEQVYAELEFIDYLSNSGANVSTMIKTVEDELLFKIDTENNEYFIVSAFTKAPGTYVNKNELTDDFVFEFGKAVGKLHRLTKEYKPKHFRQNWYEDDYIELGKKHLPEDKKNIVNIAVDHRDKIMSYPMDLDNYGLIHTDLHFGNMYYDGSVITFFDWDDASYKHFISDIAIIIFYTFGISRLSDTEIEDKTVAFLRVFIKGYEQENILDRNWYKELNVFLRLRMIILYIVIHAAGSEMLESPFGKMYMEKFEHRIINDLPFFNLEKVLKDLWSL